VGIISTSYIVPAGLSQEEAASYQREAEVSGVAAGVWQDGTYGMQYWFRSGADRKDVLLGINTGWNETVIEYSNGQYYLYLNKSLIYTSQPTLYRPISIWIGHPAELSGDCLWSGLEIDYITIESLMLTGTSIATPIWTPLPTPTCRLSVDPQLRGGFDRSTLGCPTASSDVVWAAWETFEKGYMLWRSDTNDVYILCSQQESNLSSGSWRLIEKDWDGSNPNGVGLTPPPGLYEPKRGFGWVWRTFLGGSKSQIGWAQEEEKGFCARVQSFENGFIFRSDTVTYCQDQLYNWATHPDFAPLFFSLSGNSSGNWQRH